MNANHGRIRMTLPENKFLFRISRITAGSHFLKTIGIVGKTPTINIHVGMVPALYFVNFVKKTNDSRKKSEKIQLMSCTIKDQQNENVFFNFNVTGSNLLCKQHIVLNHVFFQYESSGGKIRGFQQRSWSATIPHRENIIQAGCD